MTDEHDTSEPDLLQTYLAGTDERCPRCAYPIRGLTSSRCPECGSELRLSVALVDPHLAPYIALLTGAAVMAGWTTMFTLLAMAQAGTRWWSSISGILLLLGVVISLPILVLIVVKRRLIRRLRSTTQWTLAALLWGTGLLATFLFIATFAG